MTINDLVISPCSIPDMELDDVLKTFSELGYHKFEIFTSWVKSAFDYNADPDKYLHLGKKYNMKFTSFHLPVVKEDTENSVKEAIKADEFAAALNVKVALFKAETRPLFINTARQFLDATQHLDIIPVIQNHYGTALSILEDVKEVLEGINDKRMQALLEVGHFHSAGVSWKQGFDYLQDRIALIHIKDQIGKQSVPFGTGEIDLYGLFENMDSAGYRGDYVVEMEVQDTENTVKYLKEAIEYIKKYTGSNK